MEMKSYSDIIKSRNAISNIVSTCKDFSWTALQQTLKDTNIINAINQLLSIYHPDDGIIAYERVLKALLILSKNLDNSIQQQIISVVPLPKGVSNDKIRNLIYKITELIKASNIKSSYQKIITVPEKSNKEILNDNSKIHLNQNILLNTSHNFELNEKFVSSVPKVFKGFPPNEISTIHNHVNYMYDTLNYNISCIKPHVNIKQNFTSKVLTNEQESLKLQSKLKWFNTPHLLYKTNFYQNSTSDYQQQFFKSMDDKYFQLSIDRFNNWNHCNITDVPHTLDQNTTCLKKLHKSAITNKQNKNEILNLEVTCSDRFIQTETNYEILDNGDVNKNSKKYSSINKNKIFNMETQYFKQELNDEQAIQQDIYKMDVVHYEEERKDTIINIQNFQYCLGQNLCM
ncbi:PREDICTED: uncharacterized protein LOC108551681 [Eufriesea mexicana]|uniref:uncharacterized protein LOC108551681 n=1 Tax=Eufriesea mexicana TaxID=516756 RepID=UPI00083C3577|nr:PREDICTED: uncharacterized protein LOC108551681 [Eufriesea mexicana]